MHAELRKDLGSHRPRAIRRGSGRSFGHLLQAASAEPLKFALQTYAELGIVHWERRMGLQGDTPQHLRALERLKPLAFHIAS